MTVPQSAIDLLKLREGFSTKVYLDSLGLPTCGIGHLLLPSERAQYPVGSEVPEEQLSIWIKQDTLRAYGAAVNLATLLNVSDLHFIDVLTSVCFQLGTKFYKHFPRTWSLMMKHEWEAAAWEVQKSHWYEETPVRVNDFQKALRSLIPPKPQA